MAADASQVLDRFEGGELLAGEAGDEAAAPEIAAQLAQTPAAQGSSQRTPQEAGGG